jgi:hypothetical protein
MGFLFFYLLILINPILGQWWKLFAKMNRPTWEAFIPGYNYYQVFKITCKKPFWALLLLIPGIHLVMMMVANVSLLRRFGKFSWADTLQGIFFPYLAFHKIASCLDKFYDLLFTKFVNLKSHKLSTVCLEIRLSKSRQSTDGRQNKAIQYKIQQ